MVAQSSALNVIGVSPIHGLIGVGGVEVFFIFYYYYPPISNY
jgi:hypothetical protein